MALERGYPEVAQVNYVCFPYRCPRRENIMQMYNGLLAKNRNVSFVQNLQKKNLQLIGEQIDCREGHCAHYMRRRFEMCFPCCDSPLSVSTKAEVANCKDIRSFDSACYHYRRFGMVKP